jgi:hypothetical protein
LRDILRSFDEEIPEAATEVKQRSREDRTYALKHQEPRAWIDISVRLAFKGKAECNKKHQRDREIFQILCHSKGPQKGRLHGTNLLGVEDAGGREKFRLSVSI